MMMIRKKTGYFFIVILKTFVLLKESGAFYTPICPNDCRHGSNKIILCNNGQKSPSGGIGDNVEILLIFYINLIKIW